MREPHLWTAILQQFGVCILIGIPTRKRFLHRVERFSERSGAGNRPAREGSALAAGMVLGWNLAMTCLRTGVQMRAEEHIEREAGKILNGKQQISGRHAITSFPMAPGSRGYTDLSGYIRNLPPAPHPPVFQSHSERDPGRVMMIIVGYGLHGGGGLDQIGSFRAH